MFRKYKIYITKFIRERNIERYFPETKFLLVICPMRSGSTLLQHLLTGEKSFLAAGETKIVYKSEDDLKQLVHKVFSYNHYLGFRRKTVVEKCVHNGLIENLEIVNYAKLKIIFLLRDPVSTISSLLRIKGFGHSENIESASTYYLERVENMLSIASHVKNPNKAYFLSYEQLTEDQDRTLWKLSQFLRTKQPLKATYKLHRWTGVAGKGDITKNIQSGVIIKNKTKNHIDCSEELRLELNGSYLNAKRTLEKICTSTKDSL